MMRAPEMARTIAYLARGKLHVKAGGSEPRTVESRFATEVRDRSVRIQKRHAWKEQGRGAQFRGGLLWGMQDDPAGMAIAVRAVTQGRAPGEVLYAVQAGQVCGVFACDTAAEDPSATEQRLFHSADCSVAHLGGVQTHGYVLCAVPTKTGVSNIAVMDEDGSELTELTEGDSIDHAPSWIPGADRQLVYQSSGVGRDESGNPIGLGPSAIHKLDILEGEITCLVEDPRHDFLGPRMTEDGVLYCIRRPHRAADDGSSPLRAVLDVVLFPFRLLFAFLQYLNFFTARYTGKFLTTSGGPEKQAADARQMMIWGNLVDAEQSAKNAARIGDDPPSLVPRTWELVRFPRAGTCEVVAEGVVSFDLTPDGAVVYSNGNAVYTVASDGRSDRLVATEGITQVVVLG